MAQKRLTKHQMKEDKLVTSLFKTWEWSRLHRRQLSLGAGSVLILILVAILFLNYRAGQTRKAAELFGQALIEMQTPVAGQVQAAVTDFQILLRDYPRSKWSAQSCFYLANLLFRDGQYARAKEYYQRYVSEYGQDSLMLASAYAGLAQSLMGEKDYLSAGEYFLKGAEASPGSILAPEYLIEAGRIYLKADQKPKAVQAFQKLIQDYSGTPQANTAREELARISVT